MLAPTQAELRTTQRLFPGLNERLDRTTTSGPKILIMDAEIVGDGELQLSSHQGSDPVPLRAHPDPGLH